MIHRRTLTCALSVAVAGLLALAGCGGSGGVSPIGPGGTCNPGTQVQLAAPLPNASGVSPSIGQSVIVASDQNNTLHATFTTWNLILRDSFGNQFIGSPLSLIPFPNGPHPFPSDFYYASSIPALNFGSNYSVFLNQNVNCTPLFVGTFST